MWIRTLGLLACVAAQEISETKEDHCYLIQKEATKPRYLKFCQDYNDNACCIPGHDLEDQIQFENLIAGLGPGCKNPMMYPEIRYFYCLGCDPKQPDYVNYATGEIRLCKSFTERLWDNPTFDDCGVMKANSCPTAPTDLSGFDPYTCGDDLILPSIEFDNVMEMLNHDSFKPPGLGDFTFVEVDDDAAEACWEAPAYRSSATTRRQLAHGLGLALMLLGVGLQRVLA